MTDDFDKEEYYRKYPDRKSSPVGKAVIIAVAIGVLGLIAFGLSQPGAVVLP